MSHIGRCAELGYLSVMLAETRYQVIFLGFSWPSVYSVANQIPRNLANINAGKTMFDPCSDAGFINALKHLKLKKKYIPSSSKYLTRPPCLIQDRQPLGCIRLAGQ